MPSEFFFMALFALSSALSSQAFLVGHRTSTIIQRNTAPPESLSAKNFADEILDALDTMMGVSPLDETDLKAANSGGSEMERLMQRAQEREERAPPEDALQKPSVAIFFALLGIIPSLLFLSAVQNGFRPFGLN